MSMPWLRTEPLRTLGVSGHPRGVTHLSAASGLVCSHGRAYVVADDEHHLAVFRDDSSPGELWRLRAGDLPADPIARKRRKPDLEVLLRGPAVDGAPTLVALGSGSTPARCRGWLVRLAAAGSPVAPAREFDAEPLVRAVQSEVDAVNIEGALLQGDALVLLNRGARDGRGNAAVHVDRSALSRLLAGRAGRVNVTAVAPYDLGGIDGVSLGFTDAAALPDGGWLFSAVAEDSADAVADGRCHGSVIGMVAADGRLRGLRRVTGDRKIEGVDAIRTADGRLAVCMVTDADDPAASAWPLRTRW